MRTADWWCIVSHFGDQGHWAMLADSLRARVRAVSRTAAEAANAEAVEAVASAVAPHQAESRRSCYYLRRPQIAIRRPPHLAQSLILSSMKVVLGCDAQTDAPAPVLAARPSGPVLQSPAERGCLQCGYPSLFAPLEEEHQGLRPCVERVLAAHSYIGAAEPSCAFPLGKCSTHAAGAQRMLLRQSA